MVELLIETDVADADNPCGTLTITLSGTDVLLSQVAVRVAVVFALDLIVAVTGVTVRLYCVANGELDSGEVVNASCPLTPSARAPSE